MALMLLWGSGMLDRLMRTAERSFIWHAVGRLPRPLFWLGVVCIIAVAVVQSRRGRH